MATFAAKSQSLLGFKGEPPPVIGSDVDRYGHPDLPMAVQ
jgi:hypothetical protein